MKNDPDFINYVCDQIDDDGELSYRQMMGPEPLKTGLLQPCRRHGEFWRSVLECRFPLRYLP